VRGAGLRRSWLGRSVIAGVNSIGQLGLAMYFQLNRRPMLVQGQQMDCRVGEKGFNA